MMKDECSPPPTPLESPICPPNFLLTAQLLSELGLVVVVSYMVAIGSSSLTPTPRAEWNFREALWDGIPQTIN